MPEVRYRPGDTIVLKPNALGGVQPQSAGRIIALLPEAQRSVRYRVRLQGENFDRSIDEDDIHAEASTARRPDPNSDSSRGRHGSTWIDLSIIRTKK